jgi:hypothetical protein
MQMLIAINKFDKAGALDALVMCVNNTNAITIFLWQKMMNCPSLEPWLQQVQRSWRESICLRNWLKAIVLQKTGTALHGDDKPFFRQSSATLRSLIIPPAREQDTSVRSQKHIRGI